MDEKYANTMILTGRFYVKLFAMIAAAKSNMGSFWKVLIIGTLACLANKEDEEAEGKVYSVSELWNRAFGKES